MPETLLFDFIKIIQRDYLKKFEMTVKQQIAHFFIWLL